MITEKQQAALDQIAHQFDWSSEEKAAMAATLNDGNLLSLDRAITNNARYHDWSPAEENALREVLIGKDAPGMRVTSTVKNGITTPNLGQEIKR